MDVQQNTSRDRFFSILNDNDCPSFVIRQKQQQSLPLPPQRLPSISSFSLRPERPNFLRQGQYQRTSSTSSASSTDSPPLLRFDSTSSKSSSSSMDSTPSPMTPAYHDHETAQMPYDNMLHSGLGPAFLTSPSTITPFMESQMMLAPVGNALPPFDLKAVPPLAPSQYTGIPIPHVDTTQLPTPSLSNNASISSASSNNTISNTSPQQTNAAPPAGKKNKYPCPYAASHNCMATFTTSGHAARHGKKHTGEKGVHCPICNKAFTRKDNMKQHERTHKNAAARGSTSDDTSSSRSKAAITKEAQKVKSHKKSESESSNPMRKSSILQSPLSEATSLAPNTIDTPITATESTFFQDPSPPIMMSADPSMVLESVNPGSLYPPLGDEPLMVQNITHMDKLDSSMPMPPALIRGFSDLDTLAQAAESFDPSYYQNQF